MTDATSSDPILDDRSLEPRFLAGLFPGPRAAYASEVESYQSTVSEFMQGTMAFGEHAVRAAHEHAVHAKMVMHAIGDAATAASSRRQRVVAWTRQVVLS